MDSINASEFKAKCLALFDEIAEKGTSYLVLKRGKPVARVVPAASEDEHAQDALEGSVEILGDIVSPIVPESDWEALREEH